MNESDPMSPWKPHLVGNKTFPHHVLRLWCTRYEVAMEMCSLEDLYATLKTVHQSPGSVDTPQVSGQLSSWQPGKLKPQMCQLYLQLIGEKYCMSCVYAQMLSAHLLLLRTMMRLCDWKYTANLHRSLPLFSVKAGNGIIMKLMLKWFGCVFKDGRVTNYLVFSIVNAY